MSDIQTEAPSSGGVMVCVTGQRSCERLINHGAKRKKDDQKLFIVHCVQTGHNFMNTTFEADAIEYLFTCALLRADSVMDALVDFAVEHNVSVIVLGASPQDGADSFADKLALRLPDVELDVVRAARDR